MAQWLSERPGQPFIIENRPGGGGNLAIEAVVKAPADGHTLLLVTIQSAVNATPYDKLIRAIVPATSRVRRPLHGKSDQPMTDHRISSATAPALRHFR
jgi:tripartite-type tricarboxylate transporter receptor subunit TctC